MKPISQIFNCHQDLCRNDIDRINFILDEELGKPDFLFTDQLIVVDDIDIEFFRNDPLLKNKLSALNPSDQVEAGYNADDFIYLELFNT